MRTKQILLQQKNRFIRFGAVIIFNVALVGSACGTFAWYAYATRTGFQKEYHGTTVGELGTLQAGILSDIELPEYADYSLSEDKMTLEDEGKIIYWCANKISAETINYVVGNNGSATNEMNPVTTGTLEGNFALYRAPTDGNNYEYGEETSKALQIDYLHIPFVFRFEDAEQVGHYLPDYDIYLTELTVETAKDDQELYKAVRAYVYDGANGYLINPTADANGSTTVGGNLDLNRDGFYDYDKETRKEVIYGQYDKDIDPYMSEKTSEDTKDVPEDELTTFLANHIKDVYAVDNTKLVPSKVEYNCMDKFVSRVVSISKTDADNHNLAIVDFYTFFEGWDPAAIDKERGSGFNMNLRFEVAV